MHSVVTRATGSTAMGREVDDDMVGVRGKKSVSSRSLDAAEQQLVFGITPCGLVGFPRWVTALVLKYNNTVLYITCYSFEEIRSINK